MTLWTKEDDELLARLFDKLPRPSMTEMASHFPGRTRNAILGRAHRLGLAGDHPNKGEIRQLARAFPKATVFEISETLAIEPDNVRTALNTLGLQRGEGSERTYRQHLVAAMRGLINGEAA